MMWCWMNEEIFIVHRYIWCFNGIADCRRIIQSRSVEERCHRLGLGLSIGLGPDWHSSPWPSPHCETQQCHLITLSHLALRFDIRQNFFSFFISVKLFWSYIALPANFTLWLRSLFSQFLLLLWFPHSLSIQCQIKSGPDQNRRLQSSPSSMTWTLLAPCWWLPLLVQVSL